MPLMAYLLLDNNLSQKIPLQVQNHYGDMHHVQQAGLAAEDDLKIWHYARVRSGAIITNDSDFTHLLQRFGHPPKVIWLRIGNATTRRITKLLIDKVKQVNDFMADPVLGLLELY